MKKLFLLAVALFMVCVANAQIKEQIQKSHDRAAKLQALCDDYKACGNAGIDGYGNEMKNAAVCAIATSVNLEGMYKRQIGVTEDGVTDAVAWMNDRLFAKKDKWDNTSGNWRSYRMN